MKSSMRITRCRRCARLPTLTVFGPDRKGIVAASSDLLNRYDYTIVQSEHYTDRSENMFFQRIVFDDTTEKCKNGSVLSNNHGAMTITPDKQDAELAMETELRESMNRLGVDYELDWMRRPKRVAIMVSKLDHCLWEILLRHRADELKQCEIPVILSNHEKCRPIAETTFGIPFYVFPITNDTKEEQEQKELELLRQYDIDVVVLARYMQVLSATFLNAFPYKIINIHHSFLPAFSGGNAYQQAHKRGVKLIGATAHYATLDLDEGPIIDQDVIQVSHRDSTLAFVRKGEMLERTVLVRAVQAHLDNRVIIYNNKCVVFGD